MKIKALISAAFALFAIAGISQEDGKKSESSVQVQWMDMETALEMQKEQPRTIFVDLYTDWCGWCKKLDKETFSNPNIANYLNTHFYPVKFDAEGSDTINFHGKTYTNKGKGRRPTHELALLLTNNKPSYPSMVFIDEDGKPNKISGFMNPKKLEPILVYFAERVYKTCPYKNYHEAFKVLYRPKDSVNADLTGQIKWQTLNDAMAQQLNDGKKVLIFFYSDVYQNVSSSLTKDVLLKDPRLASYINENFHPVLFDAGRTDTITMFNQTFINEQKAPGFPHQFAIALLQNKVIFPSIVFLDENRKLLAPIQGFFPKTTLEPYLHFIAEDEFKDKDWQAYYKQFDGKIKKAPSESSEDARNK
jgi:thioredoxin-related protein